MNTMEVSLFMLSVTSLAQMVYSKPGVIEEQTLTFTFTYPLTDSVDYPEHDLFAAGVHVHNSPHMVFNVKGDHDAHILLKKDRDDFDNNVVEIVIGGWDNTKSVIRNTQQGPAKATTTLEKNEDSMLSATQFKSFWISWPDNCIKVGRGRKVGKRNFMSWCGNNSPINYVSASFGFGSGGDFQFLRTATELCYYSEFSSGAVDYTRHDLFADGIDIRSSKSIVFTTQGRNDAHLLLQKTKNNYQNNVVEVVLGGWGNTKSVIRASQQGSNEATHTDEKGDLLSVGEERPFWISWENNCIKVGRGYNVGKLAIMSWCGPTHDVNYISASYGFGSDGYFQFTRTAGAP